MLAANAYGIRFATAADEETLDRLAERDSQQPLVGRVLIGHIDGTPAAALSLHDGRTISDLSWHTDRVVAALRMRAGAIRAYEASPSVRERVRAALPPHYGSAIVVEELELLAA